MTYSFRIISCNVYYYVSICLCKLKKLFYLRTNIITYIFVRINSWKISKNCPTLSVVRVNIDFTETGLIRIFPFSHLYNQPYIILTDWTILKQSLWKKYRWKKQHTLHSNNNIIFQSIHKKYFKTLTRGRKAIISYYFVFE